MIRHALTLLLAVPLMAQGQQPCTYATGNTTYFDCPVRVHPITIPPAMAAPRHCVPGAKAWADTEGHSESCETPHHRVHAVKLHGAEVRR